MFRSRPGSGRHIGKGMGVSFADVDGDGLTDIFVANDSVRNFLFRNRGNGTFEEIGLEAGVALRDDGFAIAGMGSDLRDFDNDGKPDLIVSGILNDSFQLFHNLGGAAGFEDYGQRTGLLMGTRQFTGWGLGMYDFDNDGWKDLFFALSHLSQLDRYLGRDSALANRVFRNLGGKRFEDVFGRGRAGLPAGCDASRRSLRRFRQRWPRGMRLSRSSMARRSCSATSPKGQSHWLAVRLRGKRSNREGLGAVVHVHLADGRDLYNARHHCGRFRVCERSFGPVRPWREIAWSERIEIRWPGGGLQQNRETSRETASSMSPKKSIHERMWKWCLLNVGRWRSC